jgi:UDP-N-acetyl-D-mannosaminuronic acid dehydrogenase
MDAARGKNVAESNAFEFDVAIVGGCGRVGLPLGLAFADAGLQVVLVDRADAAVERVQGGDMPYFEEGAQEVLSRVIGRTLVATTEPSTVSSAENVIIVIGTPVDEFLMPDLGVVPSTVNELLPHLGNEQLLILRSTVFPGTTDSIDRLLRAAGKTTDIAYCPERIAEGKAMTELYTLPQLIGAPSAHATVRAGAVFRRICPSVIALPPEEAELTKLYANAWRYVKFAVANQFQVIADRHGLDYGRIHGALTFEYPRASDLPGAGFAAGPCLLKDTMQIAAYVNNDFDLGFAAMRTNEGFPLHVVSQMESNYDLGNMKVGILGMAFKSESDDRRSSLSYKLKKLLKAKAEGVMCHDPFVADDPNLDDLSDVLAQCDLLIIGAPHTLYRDLEFQVPVVDVWGVLGNVNGSSTVGEIPPYFAPESSANDAPNEITAAL